MRSASTPGVLRALEAAHRQHGRLPWARLFEPAIAAAERGVPVGARLALLLRDASAARLGEDDEARRIFFDAAGEPLRERATLRNPALADTLRRIAQGGADVFYRGEIARDIVAKVRGHARNPGLLAEQDLMRYRARERTPLCFEHRARRICGMPPPSSGTLAIAQVLGLLAERDLAALSPVPAPWGLEPAPEAVHLISEAERLAFADRNRYVADPDFVTVDSAAMLDPDYLHRRAALIGAKSMGRAEAGRPRGATMTLADDRSPELPSTTQIAVVDGFGNALAMTSSIETAFGSRLMVGGFLLNNQLTDFAFRPTDPAGLPLANRVEPGKRPRSSMAPLLVFERDSGAFEMALGSPGGAAIIAYVAKSLIGVLDLQRSIALPNFGSRNGPTELEQGRASEALQRALHERGHEIRIQPLTSGAQGIQRAGRGWFGAADPRREGVAAGD
ncbi:gamma-glutamyltransferase family protein [Piscinibacter sp.]|uniref:gamma-glutamyltransferase family protein n=1 Tax=Piscinibacter sp. TaxID=1903157 RepID=UPI003783CFE5